MVKAYLGIGSNLGNKRQNLDEAVKLLEDNNKIKIKKTSSYYETDPVGYTKQDLFLNRVLEIETLLKPYDLLEYCMLIEEKLKRERIIRWGPRTIDIDILLYEGFVSEDKKLTVPHPRMLNRAFVMVPLYEIAPKININGKEISKEMDKIKLEGIRKIDYEG